MMKTDRVHYLNLSSRARRLAGDRRGSAMISLALSLPVLMLIVIGLIDFGAHMVDATALRNAARAAVQYARVQPSDTAGIKEVATKVGKLDPEQLIVTTTLFCECGSGVKMACSQTCTGAAMQKFVSVEVKQAFTPIVPYPDIVLPKEVAGRATVRFQ